MTHISPHVPGSPPRMRGKQSMFHLFNQHEGITPAYAGKTRSKGARNLHAWDHPRVCGENNAAAPDKLLLMGSPPRVRGKQHSRLMLIRLLGITPACAGKTTAQACKDTPTRDHPRVCGENQSADCVLLAILGSPPRVRGKLELHAEIVKHFGITPACAGKTTGCPYGSLPSWDHPRVCGENDLTSYVICTS